jgi:hypothetical protein
MIDLYVGINETRWNYHPTAPGPFACVSPVYGSSIATKRENRVMVPNATTIMQDSGAFCDGPGERLDFQDAFQRQGEHATKFGYADQVTHLASYDLLIDEKWQNGVRYKERWTEWAARKAMEETIAAADWMRCHYTDPVVLSAQGVTAQQYLECVKAIVPMICNCDILGLGGWCIIGKMPTQMMPVFRETIKLIVPYAAQREIRRLHIWGVIYAPALGELLWMCDQYGLKLSTDSAGPQQRPAFGEWGYMGWRDRKYHRAPVEVRGLERAQHVRLTRQWLNTLDRTRFYREPRLDPIQLELWPGAGE